MLIPNIDMLAYKHRYSHVRWVKSQRTIAAIVASTPSPKNVYNKPRHNLVSNGTGSAKKLSIASYTSQMMTMSLTILM